MLAINREPYLGYIYESQQQFHLGFQPGVLVTACSRIRTQRKALFQLNRIVGDLPFHCFHFGQEVTLSILRMYPLTVAFKGLHRMLV